MIIFNRSSTQQRYEILPDTSRLPLQTLPLLRNPKIKLNKIYGLEEQSLSHNKVRTDWRADISMLSIEILYF